METVYQYRSTIYPERFVRQVSSDKYLLRDHGMKMETVSSSEVTKIIRLKRIYVHKASQEVIPSENVIEDEFYWIKMREGVAHYSHDEIEIRSEEETPPPQDKTR